MIHNILPHQYDPSFKSAAPKRADRLFVFFGNKVYLKQGGEAPVIPSFADIMELSCGRITESTLLSWQEAGQIEYLFAIDGKPFFRIDGEALGLEEPFGKKLYAPQIFKSFTPAYLAFAGITASQINRFRLGRRYCGRCGARTMHSKTERACVCPACGMIEYPKISPAIVVGIIDGDRILLTKYNDGVRKNWALVAGYVEVGETFKGAVRRETMEEVGLKVKDIVYYKSQPWSFSDSEMVGYFARLDGDDSYRVDQTELATAKWFSRAEIPDIDDEISLTREMIRIFKEGFDPLWGR